MGSLLLNLGGFLLLGGLLLSDLLSEVLVLALDGVGVLTCADGSAHDFYWEDDKLVSGTFCPPPK